MIKIKSFVSSLSLNSLFALVKAFKIKKDLVKWCEGIEYEKISIGQNCNAAWYLKETNNKKASYPYDWIFSSSDIVLHSIEDNFLTFLDKEQIINLNENKAGHNYYHSSLFNHKNPLATAENYQYYVRCVKRFRKVLINNKPILFVCFVIHEPEKRIAWSKGFDKQYILPIKQNKKTFEDLIHKVKQYNEKSKILFINQYTEGKLNLEYEFSSDVFWLNFTSKGKNTGLKYLNFIDDNIIKTIFKGLKG